MIPVPALKVLAERAAGARDPARLVLRALAERFRRETESALTEAERRGVDPRREYEDLVRRLAPLEGRAPPCGAVPPAGETG